MPDEILEIADGARVDLASRLGWRDEAIADAVRPSSARIVSVCAPARTPGSALVEDLEKRASGASRG